MRIVQVLALAAVAGFPAVATSATLLTTFGATNVGAQGWTSFFDLTVAAGNPNGVTITEVAVNSAEAASGTISIYTRPLTYLGSETNVAAWTLASTGAVSGTGAIASNVTDFSLMPGTYGVAIVNSGLRVAWTTPSSDYANADLSIDSGAVAGGEFSGTLFPSSTWNGQLTYEVVQVSAVPEPGEWAMMLSGLGIIGWAARRRRCAVSVIGLERARPPASR